MLPFVAASWSWELKFDFTSNSSLNTTYTFAPISSKFVLNETGEEPTEFNLSIEPDISGEPLTKCVLDIKVIKVDQDKHTKFFAWTDMSLTYEFSDAPLDVVGSQYPSGEQNATSNNNMKFYTRINEVYSCDTKIPIELGDNVTITFENMTFQAFNAEALPAAGREREVCPRDFKTNVPITALTGASLLMLFVFIGVSYGVTTYLQHRKNKKA